MNCLLKIDMRRNMPLAEARNRFTQGLAQHRNQLAYHRAHRGNVALRFEMSLGISVESVKREVSGLSSVISRLG
jgi:hypothetical protein